MTIDLPGAGATTSTVDAPDFPMTRICPFDPPEEYVELRAKEPVSLVRVPDGQLAWLITRYADVRRLLVDPRISSNRHHPNMPLTESVTRRRGATSPPSGAR